MSIGFKRSQIIEAAHRRTDGRAKSLDVDSEYATALQEVALESRWWWRRKIVAFTLKASQATYQLTGDGGLEMDDFQQAALKGFKVYGPQLIFTCPEPVFDIDVQDTILALQAQSPAGKPTRYFITGAPGTMTVDPIPDRDYAASLAHWSIPIYVPGAEDEVVTSVPAYFHTLLIKRLEMHFLAFMLTEESSKYKGAALEYSALLGKAYLYRNFAEGEVRSLVSSNCNDSVRSS